MLQSLRKGFLKFFLLAFILLGALGLVFTDVQGNFRNNTVTGNVFAIGRDKMSTTEFDNIVSNVLEQRKMKRSDAYRMGFIAQIRDQEIFNRLVLKAAHDQGIAVNDAAAALQIKQMLGPMAQQAKITEGEALRRIIQMYGVTEKKMLSDTKASIAAARLSEALSAGAEAPQLLVNDALKYQHEWRKGDYITLTAADAGKIGEPTDDQLAKYYDIVSYKFQEPERRSFSVLVFDGASLNIKSSVSNEEVEKYYNDNIATYAAPERRTVSQIVTSDEKLAKELYTLAAASKDLQKVVDQSGKGLANIVRGTYAEKDMAKELSEATFKAPAGLVQEPLKTQLGFHILLVEKIIPAATETYDQVKDKIATDLMASKSADALYERANEADDMIAGGSKLAEVAKQFNLKETTFKNLTIGDKKSGDAIPTFEKALAQAFKLGKDEASQLIESNDGKFLIVEVQNIDPAHAKPLNDVRPEIVATWKKEMAAEALDAKASKIVERVKLGESFDKIAAELGKKPDSTGLLERGSDAEKSKSLPRGVIGTLFSLDREGAVAPSSGTEGAVIVRLVERKVDTSKVLTTEEIDSAKVMLTRSIQTDILEQYKNSLMEKYNVVVNEDVIEQMYAPKEGDTE